MIVNVINELKRLVDEIDNETNKGLYDNEEIDDDIVIENMYMIVDILRKTL